MLAIEAVGIHKSYEGVKALDAVSIAVERGELFGLLGPDGAGKTTLIRILATLLLPDAGAASLEGLDVQRDFRQIRKQVGYMPGQFSLYQDLSVEENLRFFATLFGTTIEANYATIKEIYGQIEPFKKRRAGQLSGGMKQKLALSCALVHRPNVLLLDEPTTGVDPVSRREFWDILKRLQEQGITILVSTPYMDEASRCNRVALMHKGRILAAGLPDDMAAAFDKPLLEVRTSDQYRLLQDLRQQPWAHSVFLFGAYAHLALNQALRPAEVEQLLQQLGHTNTEVRETQPSIEDYFMELIRNEEI